MPPLPLRAFHRGLTLTVLNPNPNPHPHPNLNQVNPSDKLSLYGSATVADLPGQPGSGALAATSLTYEWSASPYLNLSHANITGGGGALRRSLFLLPYALQLSAGTYRLTLTAKP